MAQALEQLARQQQTLAGIAGVVRTMKSLAAVNAAPYERAASAIEAWRQTVRRGFAAYAWRMGEPVPSDPAPAHCDIVAVFGSDHGFCGNHNSAVAQMLQRARAMAGTRPPVVLCVGARMAAALQEHGIAVTALLMPPASADGIGRVAGEVVALVERHSRGRPLARLAVKLAFMRRAAHGSRAPVLATLLPLPPALLQRPRRWPGPALPDFAGPPQAVLAALVRAHLFASVFHASAEAMVTENAARLARMQQAEQALDERLALLGRQISGVRQDQITDELMDIVVGHMPAPGRRTRAPVDAGHGP
ncbi:MAG TPA: F0F1 ATP synthase subunit gamma [Ottowia sp.]|uniref:F0F1 ATP synthase subunit gamma n=1 Tax=Ottowia sp. TaxID=1898956 RepID=UPI002CD4942E|nr:F0F1 ATP synthase subunit gamma [Ottowia sp.]HMN22247.1 F0F1 ATP synthase subunit gamma [Ottowia sp.]